MSAPLGTSAGKWPSSDRADYRRYWLIPLAVLLTFAAAGAVYFLLATLHVIPSTPFGVPYPPFWIFFPFGFFAFWALTFLLVRAGGGWRGGWGHRWGVPMDAAEVVRIRFARGEIGPEEMSRMLGDLDETARAQSGRGV